MNELELIRSKIYEIRGQKVMLDFDLADLYASETKQLKRAVKRNMKRFPEDFMFELKKEEFDALRCQIGTSKGKGGVRYMPFAFTEQGVAMLSSILNSELAIQVNIGIMRAFVAVRQMIALPQRDRFDELKEDVRKLREYVEDILTDQNEINDDTTMRLELIEQSLAELQAGNNGTPKSRERIGFKAD